MGLDLWADGLAYLKGPRTRAQLSRYMLAWKGKVLAKFGSSLICWILVGKHVYGHDSPHSIMSPPSTLYIPHVSKPKGRI